MLARKLLQLVWSVETVKKRGVTMEQVRHEIIETTNPVLSQRQAIDKKVNFLEARILGFPTMKFTLVSDDMVYVPYRAFLFWFDIKHRTLINRTDSKETRGELAFVFDCNECHPFEYDLNELGALEIKKIKPNNPSEQVLKESCTRDEAIIKTEFYINNKLLRRLYGTTGTLTLLEDFLFYRPARRLGIIFKGSKVVNERFAYMDDYDLLNDNIAGLRSRVGGGG
jgi:hypothetical protein